MRTDAICVLLMADEKVGKTVATGYGVGNVAVFAGLPEALEPLRSIVGIKDPRIESALVILDYIKVIDKVATAWKGGSGAARPIVVADDFGLAVARTEGNLRETAKPNQKGVINVFDIFSTLKTQWSMVINHAASKRVGLIMSVHATAPKEATKDDPVPVPGRPQMPTAELSKDIGRHPSTIIFQRRTNLNAPANSEFLCGSGVPRFMNGEPMYITGDRYGKAPPKMYPALGELLRAQGFAITRPPEVERFEGLIDQVARGIAAGQGTRTQAAQFVIGHESTASEAPWVLRWILGDIFGRADLLAFHSGQALRDRMLSDYYG